MSRLTQPLKWHGGKHYLAKWIVSKFPARDSYEHYVEPYFGGGSVLLHHDPEGKSEVAGDWCGELANFWGVLRSESHFRQLVRLAEATPFSEELFETIGSQAFTSAPVERAWAFLVRNRMSRQGLMKDFATLSRNRTRRGMNEQVSSWLTAVEGLPEVHRRLRRVVVVHGKALDLIRRQDGPNTFFYLDPPYLHETRTSTGEYEKEMTEDDHSELLVALGLIRGRFLLSGYPSDLYETHARLSGWSSTFRLIDNKASSQAVKPERTEMLWANYDLS